MASNFKVIVVGAGPVGLSTAHALHLAGIDFVVLERREKILEDVGASLIFGAGTLRVLAQFGILERLLEIGTHLDRMKSFDMTGYKFADHLTPEVSARNHGTASLAFHRAEVVEALYDGLPPSAKVKVLPGKSIIAMTSSSTSASVTCADGTTYTGSMILGADGVHSQTRRLMRDLALAADPTVDWDPESPYMTQYRSLWCSFPRPGEPCQVTDTQSKGRAAMYVTGKQHAWIFLNERLPQATNDRTRYTEADIQECAERFADVPINETLKVKDVFDIRRAGMANLEEGVAKNWSWGRVALMGDSCHKFTPNAGRGYVSGVQDVVAVTNRLRSALQSSPDGTLSTTTLSELFEDYQRTRLEEMEPDVSVSWRVMRLHTWANGIYHFAARYLLCWGFFHKLIANRVNGPQMAASQVLDFVSMEEPFIGAIPWKHPMPSFLVKVEAEGPGGESD